MSPRDREKGHNTSLPAAPSEPGSPWGAESIGNVMNCHPTQPLRPHTLSYSVPPQSHDPAPPPACMSWSKVPFLENCMHFLALSALNVLKDHVSYGPLSSVRLARTA